MSTNIHLTSADISSGGSVSVLTQGNFVSDTSKQTYRQDAEAYGKIGITISNENIPKGCCLQDIYMVSSITYQYISHLNLSIFQDNQKAEQILSAYQEA